MKSNRIKKVASSESHIVFLLEDGTCKAMGDNEVGQLGDGTFREDKDEPVSVCDVENCVDVAAGFYNTFFLLEDGRCLMSGRFYDYIIYEPELVEGVKDCVSIEAYGNHVYFLLRDGTCLSDDYRKKKSILAHLETPKKEKIKSDCVQIATGAEHTVFRLSDGTCFGVGDSLLGQLGYGSSVDLIFRPKKVKNVENCIGVFAGKNHTLFLLEDGSVLGTGSNRSYQLGIGDEVDYVVEPVPIPGVENCIDVAAGDEHTVFVLKDGTCLAAGDNKNFKTGILPDEDCWFTLPTPVPDIDNCIGATAARDNTVFLKEDGSCVIYGKVYPSDKTRLGEQIAL